MDHTPQQAQGRVQKLSEQLDVKAIHLDSSLPPQMVSAMLPRLFIVAVAPQTAATQGQSPAAHKGRSCKAMRLDTLRGNKRVEPQSARRAWQSFWKTRT